MNVYVFLVQEQPNGIIEAFSTIEKAVEGIKRFKKNNPLVGNSYLITKQKMNPTQPDDIENQIWVYQTGKDKLIKG
jgi:hypothetical protein